MPLTSDIVATYRTPRRVIRRLLTPSPREDRALLYVMLACGLIFVAQWPRLAREAHLSNEVPLDALLGGALFGWLFLAPLALYLLAALSRLAAGLLGGRGSWYSARLALFWSLLAAAPLWLLNGLVAGFVGPGAALQATGLLALVGFLAIWFATLAESERSGATP